ncbi:MAG: lipopolysaccharide heptosyltransferase II [Acidobacteria bacterium]|nr:lipopolysaccharide heptosyltransferase II [Acidobacteriota bacterium]
MRILVRGTNWIGDAVMTIPAMRRLRRAFPEAHIALHCRKWAEGIFRDVDFLDEIIPIQSTDKGLNDLRDEAERIRRGRFDVAVMFPNSFRSAALPWLGKIPRRFGYEKEMRGFLLTDRVAIPAWKSTRHEIYYYLNLVEAVETAFAGSVDAAAEAPDISIAVSATRKAKAREFLESIGCDAGLPIVALGCGSTNSRAKRWPAERFAKLATHLIEAGNASVVLLGSSDERDVAEQVESLADSRLINAVGKTSLEDAVSLLAAADVFVSNDMGLAHISAAVGTPTLVIFGPTNPETTRPFSPLAEVIRVRVDCSPCMLRDCPIDHRCMTSIEPDIVGMRVLDILNSARSNG